MVDDGDHMNFVKGMQWRQGGCDTVRLTMKSGDGWVVDAITYKRTNDEYKELVLFGAVFDTYEEADQRYRKVVEHLDAIYDEFGNEIEEENYD